MDTVSLNATIAKARYVLRWISWGCPADLRRWARLDKCLPGGDTVTYHLRQTWDGELRCSCRGYSVHGHCHHSKYFLPLFLALPPQTFVDTERDLLAPTVVTYPQPLNQFDAA